MPRPETETVVEAALCRDRCLAARVRGTLHIADFGTGSGALLLALLTELPNAFGVGTDTSLGALCIARDNARRLRLARAAFVVCDMGTALRGPFDLIVSNPPYIASSDIAALPSDVRDFDPRPALDGGADGLDCYRAIAAAAPALLKPDRRPRRRIRRRPGASRQRLIGLSRPCAVAAAHAICRACRAPSLRPRPETGKRKRAMTREALALGKKAAKKHLEY